MAEGAAIVRSFRVGKRTATLTIQAPRSGRANYVTGWRRTLLLSLLGRRCVNIVWVAVVPSLSLLVCSISMAMS
jgi:hypothetical protein